MEDRQLTCWRKSTRSANGGDSCVEVALWRKSSHSGNGGNTCVEVASFSTDIAVRDSKDPGGPHLHFSRTAWRTFTTALKHR